MLPDSQSFKIHSQGGKEETEDKEISSREKGTWPQHALQRQQGQMAKKKSYKYLRVDINVCMQCAEKVE